MKKKKMCGSLSDTAMFRKFYVLLDAAPCCSSKETLGEISTILGSSKFPLMHSKSERNTKLWMYGKMDPHY